MNHVHGICLLVAVLLLVCFDSFPFHILIRWLTGLQRDRPDMVVGTMFKTTKRLYYSYTGAPIRQHEPIAILAGNSAR